MKSTGNNVISHDRDGQLSFEIIGDGQSTTSHQNQTQNDNEQLRKMAEIFSNSSPILLSGGDKIFIRRRHQMNKEKKNQNFEPISADDDADEDLDSGIKVKLNVEKEILKLKAKVENLAKLNSPELNLQEGQNKSRNQGQGQDQFEKIRKAEKGENGQVGVKEDGKKDANTANGTEKIKREQENPEDFPFNDDCRDCAIISCVMFFLMLAVLIIIYRESMVNNDEVQQSIQQTLQERLEENVRGRLKENANVKRRVNGAKNVEVEEETQNEITKSIYLYSQKNFEGSSHVVFNWQLNENTCYNLVNTGDDSASSIDTQGECVYVFEDSDCRGKEHKFSSETINQHDLGLSGLDKKISSLQACCKRKE